MTETTETMTYERARDLPRAAQGVRYFVNLSDWDADEEITYSGLVACLRMDDNVDTEGYSDGEIWPDLIVPMIVSGTIEHAVWGVIS